MLMKRADRQEGKKEPLMVSSFQLASSHPRINGFEHPAFYLNLLFMHYSYSV
jgi:hypothetical protein